MDKFSNAMDAVGQAAKIAGELGGKAYNIAKGIKVPGGIKNAAEKAYETAKQLKNSIPIGSIGSKALNAARTFKNAVRDKIKPQAIADSATKAATFIGRAVQGAGSKISNLGSTIKKSFYDHGGWGGVKDRAFAPVNVGNRTNPFRVPVPAWYAASTGQMPQKSIFMPSNNTTYRSGWWGRGGRKKRSGGKTHRKKSTRRR
jgi:hypothetical protein